MERNMILGFITALSLLLTCNIIFDNFFGNNLNQAIVLAIAALGIGLLIKLIRNYFN